MIYFCLLLFTICFYNVKILESKMQEKISKLQKKKPQDRYSNNERIEKLEEGIQKLEERIEKLESSHYDYEYLSEMQQGMKKRLEIIYRDVKDDFARINQMPKNC